MARLGIWTTQYRETAPNRRLAAEPHDSELVDSATISLIAARAAQGLILHELRDTPDAVLALIEPDEGVSAEPVAGQLIGLAATLPGLQSGSSSLRPRRPSPDKLAPWPDRRTASPPTAGGGARTPARCRPGAVHSGQDPGSRRPSGRRRGLWRAWGSTRRPHRRPVAAHGLRPLPERHAGADRGRPTRRRSTTASPRVLAAFDAQGDWASGFCAGVDAYARLLRSSDAWARLWVTESLGAPAEARALCRTGCELLIERLEPAVGSRAAAQAMLDVVDGATRRALRDGEEIDDRRDRGDRAAPRGVGQPRSAPRSPARRGTRRPVRPRLVELEYEAGRLPDPTRASGWSGSSPRRARHATA